MGRVKIAVENITVVNRKDELRKEDAYLWVWGLQILPPQSGVLEREFVRLANGRPGNLGDGFKRGESRAVPAGTGTFEYDVSPLFGKRLLLGVVVIGWDHDRTPETTVERAYLQAGNLIDAEIRKIVNAVIADLKPGSTDFRDVTDAEQRQVEAAVRELVKDIYVASLSIRPWTLNPEDLVGKDRLLVAIDDATLPFAQTFTFELREHEHIGAHYRVTGRVTWTP